MAKNASISNTLGKVCINTSTSSLPWKYGERSTWQRRAPLDNERCFVSWAGTAITYKKNNLTMNAAFPFSIIALMCVYYRAFYEGALYCIKSTDKAVSGLRFVFYIDGRVYAKCEFFCFADGTVPNGLLRSPSSGGSFADFLMTVVCQIEQHLVYLI